MQEVAPPHCEAVRALLDRLIGEPLTAIRRHVLDEHGEHSQAFEWLLGLDLYFGRKRIRISVNADDDTLSVSKRRGVRKETLVIDGSLHPLWAPLLNKHLAFAWVMTNSKGYLDGLAFAFELYAPSAVLVVAGSQIHEFSTLDRDRRVGSDNRPPR